MGLLERVNRQVANSRPKALTLEDWASWFSFRGTDYPILQTTYSQLDHERVAFDTSQAAKFNGPTFALILARMQVFSQIRFQWTRFQGAQPSDLFGSAELRPLERPWPGGTTADLLARMEWDVSTVGNAYVRRVGDTLHRLHPIWTTIVLGSNEEPGDPAYAGDTTLVGYLWAPPGLKPKFLGPDQVAHYAPLPDPQGHFIGISWIESVLRELQGDQASVEHKYRFFENGATPNMAIGFDPAVTYDQVKQFKELMETEHRGVRDAWKTLYLGGGGKPLPIGSTFQDMDYAVIQGKAESRLAAAAGVPPSWVGFSEGLQGSALNAGNFNSARRRFSDGTMAHLWANAASSLEPIISQPRDRTGKLIGGASLWYDARIPFMRADEGDLADIQSKEASTITMLIRDGFTPASAVSAVKNNDWTLLEHSGLTSVQLVPPSSGQEPVPGFSPTAVPGPAPSPNGTPASAGANGRGGPA